MPIWVQWTIMVTLMAIALAAGSSVNQISVNTARVELLESMAREASTQRAEEFRELATLREQLQAHLRDTQPRKDDR